MRAAIWAILLGMQAAPSPDEPRPPTASEQYQALIRDRDAYVAKAKLRGMTALTAAARARLQEENTKATHELGKRAVDLARAYPNDPVAVDALLGVLNEGLTPEATDAWRLLTRDHAGSDRIGPALLLARRDVFTDPYLAESFLRAVLDRSPHRAMKGQACLALAAFLHFRSASTRSQAEHPEVRTRIEGYLKTPEDRAMYRDRSPDDLSREAEGLYERVVAEFGDVKDARDRPLGPLAKGMLFEIRHLGLGKVAPEIEGEDADGVRFKLGDYRGKVVVLTFSGNWCGPCLAMYPQERALVDRHKGKPFALVSVNTDRDVATLKKSIASGEVTWRCWSDGAPGGPITGCWGISGYPTIYVLDHRGVIRHKSGGPQGLDEIVDKLLEEAKAADSPRS
jgi:thiol-disulfide isomerase/thioredoxin